MRLYWHNIANSNRYQYATAAERRMIELRFSIAKAVRAKRRELWLTQAELAARIGSEQATVCAIECGHSHVSLELAVKLLVHMGATDAEIAMAFNAGASEGVQKIRERALLRCFPRPRAALAEQRLREFARDRLPVELFLGDPL